ncbi:serine hydrolase [Lactimicrobium sp.]|uniref:serine hydrolase n=1 Tax=Lactimicrobium sp. TaxID=2563780 RepID=UPI002F35016E
MKKKLLNILCVLSLPGAIVPTPAKAEDSVSFVSLDARIQQFLDEYDLDEDSFSLAYYNTVSNESWQYNGDTYMFAASTYKLPLNMYYYLQENAGNIDPDEAIGMYTLSQAHYLSIVQSDNPSSETMMYALGSYDQYKDLMFETFGSEKYQEEGGIDPITYQDNDYPADFLMDVLQYLYNNQDQFQELLSYMSDPEQNNGFDNDLAQMTAVYQKQGWYDYVNDVAEIVMSDQPYLAVIMVDVEGRYDSAEICEAANDLLYQYNQDCIANDAAVQAAQSDDETASDTETPQAESTADTVETSQKAGVNWPLLAGVIGVFGGLFFLVLHISRN